MTKYALLAAAMLLLVSAAALADAIAPIIVTATRTAQTADATLSAVTVITRNEIERQQAQSVQDLLRGFPGVSIANNGGPGKVTSVFLRGTEADHVLVLIDGIKVGSATSGTTAFEDIPVEQIERIEIVRGPRSSLYGSEAIGGVIQIFTRKGSGALKPYFSVGGGSDQTYRAAASISGGGERSWFSMSSSGMDTEGFNACDGKPAPDGAGCFTSEPDQDGYRNLSGTLRAGYHFDNGAEVDVHTLRATGDSEFDGGFVNQAQTVQQVLGATVQLSPVSRWQITLAGGQSRDQADNFKDGAFKSRYDTARDTLSWQNDVSLATDHLLTLGADSQNDRVNSSTAFAVTSRDNTGLFAQYQGRFDAHDLQLSLRRDDNAQFGGHNTGGAAWGYALRDDLRLTTSYGTAFKVPTFNELYWPDGGWGGGNPELNPEQAQSLEGGIRYTRGPVHWEGAVFQTKVRDLISGWPPANINRARMQGLELETSLDHGSWQATAALTLLEPKDRDTGNELPQRARQSLRLDADRDFGRYRLGANLHAASNRYNDLANRQSLGGYATLDLRGEQSLSRDWRIQARVENLLDQDYETVAFYNPPGRSLYLTLRYQP